MGNSKANKKQQNERSNEENKSKEGNKSKKRRTLIELINIFYEYLSQHDEVFLSAFRDNEEDMRIHYPSNKRILKIIDAIQNRPYIYIKKPNEQNTLLKLSSHERDPKTRFIQINDVIQHMEEQSEHLEAQVKKASKDDYKMWIQQYQNLISESINEMKRLRDRDKEYLG